MLLDKALIRKLHWKGAVVEAVRHWRSKILELVVAARNVLACDSRLLMRTRSCAAQVLC